MVVYRVSRIINRSLFVSSFHPSPVSTTNTPLLSRDRYIGFIADNGRISIFFSIIALSSLLHFVEFNNSPEFHVKSSKILSVGWKPGREKIDLLKMITVSRGTSSTQRGTTSTHRRTQSTHRGNAIARSYCPFPFFILPAPRATCKYDVTSLARRTSCHRGEQSRPFPRLPVIRLTKRHR